MSDYITFKLWKLGIFCICAFIYGFIIGPERPTSESSERQSTSDE